MAENKKGQVDKMNPVAEMLAFNEAVKKENQHSAIWENFTINPRKLQACSEKPQHNIMITQKVNLSASKTTDPAETLINEKLTQMKYTPKMRLDVPETSNQNIGWYVQQHGGHEDDVPRSKRFTYRRNQCNETNYANRYYTMNKISPFSNLNK